jgi:serine/threonine protein kinase
MEHSNQSDDNCVICGKSKTAAAGQSLTQWIFESDVCRCDSKQFATNPNMCQFCGKALTKGAFASMTQWIFHPDLCSCERNSQDFMNVILESSAAKSLQPATTESAVQVSPQSALIKELETGEIDYHGLPPESFPFERFRIIKEVGRGGAGVVYETWDCLLKRRTAIKTMHTSSISPEEVIRLQNEARTSSRLKHPTIIRILDFGAAPTGQPYLVSDFIDGKTLKDRLDSEGPLPMRDALPMFIQLTAGILHAHEQGVFHRDLKSSNVMITNDTSDGAVVKIIDFGVARIKQALSQTSKIVETATLVGTPYYMSPEQGAGKAFDARSEVYSIGCMMFETFAGRVPFQGETALETLAMHSREPVPQLLIINPNTDCSELFEAAIYRCLEKDPDKRFQTVAELNNHLQYIAGQRLGDDIESAADNQRADALAKQAAKRSKSIAFVSIGVLALLGGGLLIWQSISNDSPTDSSKTALHASAQKPTPTSHAKLSDIPVDEGEDIDLGEGASGFYDSPLFSDKKPWTETTLGNFVGSMWTKDESFRDLQKQSYINWVESPLSSELTGSGINFILNKDIRNIHINSQKLSDTGLARIDEMKTLEFITLSISHDLTEKTFRKIASLPKLSALKLQDLSAPGNLLELFADKPAFKVLYLMDKPPKTPPTNWAPLTKMSRMKFFGVIKYDFKDKDLKHLKSLNKLYDLRLVQLGLHDFDADKLLVSKLKYLDLSCNPITDKTVAKLASVKTLKRIDLTGCDNVTADGINQLQAKLPKCEIISRPDRKPDRGTWAVGSIAHLGNELGELEGKKARAYVNLLP